MKSRIQQTIFALLALVIPAFALFQSYELWQAGASALDLANIIPALLLTLTYWLIGLTLLLRLFQRVEARLLFLLSQCIGLALLIPLAYPDPRHASFFALSVSITGLHFSGPLLLHLHISFPRRLGENPWRRRILVSGYTLAAASALAWWLQAVPWWQASMLYTVSVIMVAVGILIFMYYRRSSADDRQRLRLVVLGTALPTFFIIFFDMLPTLAGFSLRAPTWALALLLIFNPLSYAYAISRRDLLGVDRLLNRALVYAILSIGIFGFYLGPFLLLYRLLPENIGLQMIIISGLTLFVGWSFNAARMRVQRWVDQIFYGGWYDYPGVVETVSDALAGSTERSQIFAVLTRQVPEMMQLASANLWIGQANATYPQTPPQQERFRFKFQSEVPAQWTVSAHKDGSDLTENDHRILNTLARQAEIAINNVILIETLRTKLDEIQASRAALAQAQRQLLRSREDERTRLARDLHDSPIQTLVGLNIQLGLLLTTDSPLPAGEGPGVRADGLRNSLSEMRAEVRGLLGELRQVCADLRPPMLDALGLGAALRAHADEWGQQNNIRVHFDAPEDITLSKLPDEVAVNLFRVAQETLGNISKHARASSVNIHLRGDKHQLQLSIHDDGRGFEKPPTLNGLPSQNHFGLVGMRERIELIGGDWSLESKPGEGTRVDVAWKQPKQ